MNAANPVRWSNLLKKAENLVCCRDPNNVRVKSQLATVVETCKERMANVGDDDFWRAESSSDSSDSDSEEESVSADANELKEEEEEEEEDSDSYVVPAEVAATEIDGYKNKRLKQLLHTNTRCLIV